LTPISPTDVLLSTETEVKKNVILAANMSATPPQPKSSEPGEKGLRERVYDVLLDLIPEGVTTIGLLAIIGLGRFLLKLWIGDDARFFDVLKVRWVFDSGDLVILLRFLWMSVRKFR
jgi:hypothetical protein